MDEGELWVILLQIEAELDRRCQAFRQRCQRIRMWNQNHQNNQSYQKNENNQNYQNCS